jgi:hypothetical protein
MKRGRKDLGIPQDPRWNQRVWDVGNFSSENVMLCRPTVLKMPGEANLDQTDGVTGSVRKNLKMWRH